jgi:hypothetical protein
MLEAPYNDLYSLWKLVWGGAETSWRNARRFTVANLDANPSVQFAPDYVEKLEEKLLEAQHGLKDNIITRGTDVSVLGGPVDKFDANGNFLLDLIGGTVQIQKRNLLGSEKVGELASGLDRKRNADAISSVQEGFADPLVRDLSTRLIDFGYFIAPLKKSRGKYEVVFAVEEEMGEDEKAQWALTMANANKAQVEAEGIPIRLSKEMRDFLWEDDPIDPQDLQGGEGEEGDEEDLTEIPIDDPTGDEDASISPDETADGQRSKSVPSVNERVHAEVAVDVTDSSRFSRLKVAKIRLQKEREKVGRR